MTAFAGTPYTVHWEMFQESNSCEDARLSMKGGAYFHGNGMPLATFEVPGAYFASPDGSRGNVAEAPFDSVLLRMGTNEFSFGVTASTGNNTCVHSQNFVTLVAPTLGIQKPLFDVRRDGTAFSGSTQVGLALAEINPPLAQAITNLEVAIAHEREALLANASAIAELDERLSFLRELDLELHDLVQRPLDEIAQVDLDAILDRYTGVVDEATRAALKELIDDLKQSVVDLQNELASLAAEFGAQADAVADFLTADARTDGFNPDDPFNYGLGPSGAPSVDIPDLSGVPGAFEPGKDPYAAYADAVIAALAEDVSGGKVIDRGSFVATVRAWRSNQAAIEKALLTGSGVTQAEMSAFLNAQNKVTNHLKHYMDAADWLLDSQVPPDVRAQVDGVLKNLYGAYADELKDALNAMGVGDGGTVDLEKTHLFQMIRAFSAGVSELGEVAAPYVDVIVTMTHAATRIGIGFVPYVGAVLDLCEAVTGKEFCLPAGRDLSLGERIFSAVGTGVGAGVAFHKGMKNAPIGAVGKATAQGVVEFGEELVEALRTSRIKKWRELKRGGYKLSEKLEHVFERDVALYLIKKEGHKILALGDGEVRRLLDILESSQTRGVSRACDFLTVTPTNGLVLSDSKFVGPMSVVNVPKALSQFDNVMAKLGERNVAGFVERVQIVVPKGANLKAGFKIGEGGKLTSMATGELVKVTGAKNVDLVVHVVEI
ncbi:hypothetical protein [Polyangium mundeleinium]|uniref:Uncharacterized protein n=1 Tax=Polyangium mundeleinium TaxID=2995306 RepID=A0ABT5EQB7_9BACT|nr:hypothetical protein [Polyangium mundeleinium]MDC0744031.1 hypothetical protein [Polyangium mundeleinium]